MSDNIKLKVKLKAYSKAPLRVSDLENDLHFVTDTDVEQTLENYVTKPLLNETIDNYDATIKSYVSNNYIDNRELSDTLQDYTTIQELDGRDYVPDLSNDDGKVYGRTKGHWYWLDLENMGAINIITPTNSGLKSREIPKEESGEARNAYEIELNKWEGNLEDLPQVLEEGKFYYAIDPVEVSQVLQGGSASTNNFENQVDILTTRFQLRTDTRLSWQQNNPTLDYGEPGWETDTGKLKIGDGVSDWNTLSYVYGILNNNVITDLSISSNGDNTSIVVEKTNLNTQNTTTTTVGLPLADGTQSGLMAIADYTTLQDLVSRVSNLEGKTTRLLYQATLLTSDITIIDSTILKKGTILKSGSIVNGVEIAEDETLNEDTQLDNADVIKTGSIVANSSVINDVAYPNADSINAFAIRQGYTSPFEGIAVVIAGTYHIWHYYENEINGVVIGWKDDGLDTVSNFTNETPGVILGSQQAGKVFAENDGTGSVYGWDALTNNVSNLSSSVTGIINSKVTTIDENSTNATYPSTKAVYDFVTTYTPEITSLTNQEIDDMWDNSGYEETGDSLYDIPLDVLSYQGIVDYLEDLDTLSVYDQGDWLMAIPDDELESVEQHRIQVVTYDTEQDALEDYEQRSQRVDIPVENGTTVATYTYVATYGNIVITEYTYQVLTGFAESGNSLINLPIDQWNSWQDVLDYFEANSSDYRYQVSSDQIYAIPYSAIDGEIIHNDVTILNLTEYDAARYYDYYLPYIKQQISMGEEEMGGQVYDWIGNYEAKNGSIYLIETQAVLQQEPPIEDGEVINIVSNDYQVIEDSDGGLIYIINTENNDGEVITLDTLDYTTYYDDDGGIIYVINTNSNGEVVDLNTNDYSSYVDSDGGTIYEINTENNGEVVNLDSYDYSTTTDSDGGTIYEILTESQPQPSENPNLDGNLLTGPFIVNGNEIHYNTDEHGVLSIFKDSKSGEWECLTVDRTGDYSNFNRIKYTVRGAFGEEIMFKVNGRYPEETVTLNGDMQEGYIAIPQDYDENTSPMVIFPNPGIEGTANPIYIYELNYINN